MIAVCDHNSAGNVGRRAGGRRRRAWRCSPAWRSPRPRSATCWASSPTRPPPRRPAPRSRRLLPEADAGYDPFFGEQPLLDAEGARPGRETAALAVADAARPRRGRDAHPPRTAAWPSRRTSTARRSACSRSWASSRRTRLRRRRAAGTRRPASPRGGRSSRLSACPCCTRPTPLPEEIGAGAHRAALAERRRFAELALALRRPGRTEVRRPMHDLSLYLLELLENSIRAGATVVDVELAVERERRPTRDPRRGRRAGLPVGAGAGPRPVLHDQARQEDRPGPEPASGRRPRPPAATSS